MITIKVYNGGYLSYNAGAQKLGIIASSVTPQVEWEFGGTLGEFAERWNDKFLAYRDGSNWLVYVTQHGTFSTR